MHRPEPIRDSDPSPTPDRGPVSTRSATRPCGSSVSIHVAISTSVRVPGPGGRLLEPGHDEDRRRAGDDGEHRQPLQRHRPVAGQVVEIRADADQGGGEAALGDERGQTPEALGVALGGDPRRRGGARSSGRNLLGGGWIERGGIAGRRAGSVAASQRAIVAGPSSNSLR